MSRSRRRLNLNITWRIMLVTTAAILLCLYVRPSLSMWVFDTWARDYDRPPQAQELAPELERLIEDPRIVETDEEYAAWLDEIATKYMSVSSAIYVLDANSRLVYRAPMLSDIDPETLVAHTRFKLQEGKRLLGVVICGLYPLAVDGRSVGVMGRVYFDFDTTGPIEEDWPVFQVDTSSATYTELAKLGKESYRESRRYYNRIRWAIDGGVAVATAALLGLLASFFLSRRLVRLARQIDAADDRGIPGPFDVRGRDEIASLSIAMNEMRERIGDLVAGLERRDTARREWVAQVSHDLRTPLTSLRICLGRAEAELPSTGDAELRRVLRVAQHDARRLQALTEDLVDAARLEAGAALDIEPVLPREVMRDAIRSVRPIAEHEAVEIVVDGHGAVDPIEADGRRLLRACENLLRNAVRHAHSYVEVATASDEEGVVFRVRDDGPGFGGAPGKVDVHEVRSTSQRGEGAALGLLVVDHVARAHGGSIELRNLDDGGAEACLRIPVARSGSLVHA